MLQVDIDLSDLDREWRRGYTAVGRDVGKWLTVGVNEGAEEARKGRFKDQTGEARRQTKGRVEGAAPGSAYGWLECLVPYASYLDEGTAPHVIRPKFAAVGPVRRGQSRRGSRDIGTTRVALRWYDSGGAVHFARVVHHPGSPAFGFMGAGAAKAERVIVREAEMSFDRLERLMSAA